MNILDRCAELANKCNYAEMTEEDLFDKVKNSCYELLTATCAYIGSPQYEKKCNDSDVTKMCQMLRKTGFTAPGADVRELTEMLFQVVSGFIMAHIPDEAYKEFFGKEASDD